MGRVISFPKIPASIVDPTHEKTGYLCKSLLMEFHIKEFQAVVNNFKQKQDPIIRKQEEMLNDAAGRQSGFLYIDTHEIDLYEQLIGDELGEFYG